LNKQQKSIQKLHKTFPDKDINFPIKPQTKILWVVNIPILSDIKVKRAAMAHVRF